ncbi:hypothetical protein KFU94_56235 [Chloroflexi bacterium TSY]|nr:hypothetical protein [Chloroflexi bacterium TSY]
MANAIYTATGYRRRTTRTKVEAPNRNEVTFVPTFTDLQTPTRKVMKVLPLRRHLLDLFGGFVSGAVSLR